MQRGTWWSVWQQWQNRMRGMLEHQQMTFRLWGCAERASERVVVCLAERALLM